MNCLEWLPIYFGILKSGAVAVPLNFRYTAEEIKYCLIYPMQLPWYSDRNLSAAWKTFINSCPK